MDVKVYKKEEVLQGSIYVPDIIDLYPRKEEKEGVIYITSFDTVVGKEELEQSCSLSTIWQRGNDPLDLASGVRWSETLLEETSVLELMEDITTAVSNTTDMMSVTFDIVENKNGRSLLTYYLEAVL